MRGLLLMLIGGGPGRNALFLGMLIGLPTQSAIAQLAITEVMSSASSNVLADFWELTNFGTNDINLNGYRWNDNNGGVFPPPTDAVALDGLTISNQESIIFMQSSGVITNEQAFRDWWGPNLPVRTRIIVYGQTQNGFGRGGDGIRLWGPGATNDADVIESVDFGEARTGSTVTYDPATGFFGQYSVEGVGGAFRSALYNDVGSPGVHSGPVLLRILPHPTSLNVCAGMDGRIEVLAAGFPRPTYQWFFNDVAIPGAVLPALTLTSAQPTNTGLYRVEINNGFQSVTSAVVTVTVSTNPSPPVLQAPLTDVNVISNETARFTVVVCAYPPPAFRWLSNNVPISGATNRTLVIPNTRAAMSGLYCVSISNSLGTTTACARLMVSSKPKLLITEVMPASSTNCASGDWFELTNGDTFDVNLLGYRFATGNGFSPTLSGAWKITDSILLRPGQSAIFYRGVSAADFIHWWGADRLPRDLPVSIFSGFGLGAVQDELYVWSPGAEDPANRITEVSWAGASAGISKYYLGNTVPSFDYESELGKLGAFGAESCVDIGSPGYITNPPPAFVRASRDAAGVLLKWRAVSNATYYLKWKQDLNAPQWTPLITRPASNWVETYLDAPATDGARYYSIEQAP